MADILQDFPIKASAERVYQAVSTPTGLDAWWTLRSTGEPNEGAIYELDFGPGYDWRAKVIQCVTEREFALQMVVADDDWSGTQLCFRLEEKAGSTWVRFTHTGWPVENEHFRISCHCWAMYLRLLRRYVEFGEQVPYLQRLEV